MLLGGLKFDLLVHFGLSVAITVLLLIRYGDQTSVDNFDWNHTLSGTAAIISLVHSVISGLNLAKDVLWTGEKCENKKLGQRKKLTRVGGLHFLWQRKKQLKILSIICLSLRLYLMKEPPRK